MASINPLIEVESWGSEPDTNDDCWYGKPFDTVSEAFEYIREGVDDVDAAWFRLVINGERETGADFPNPKYSKERRREADCEEQERSERAILAGMAGGCQAYNETRGCESMTSEEHEEANFGAGYENDDDDQYEAELYE